MKRIVTGKSRTPSMLLVPTVFYSHYHNCGEKIVDIGIAFLRRAYGISIAIKPKNKPQWYDAQGDNVPEYGREVIVIGRDGKVFYGHRPDPKEVTMVDGKPYHAKTYDKNGWNWPDIALWLDVEVPDKLIDEITTKYFDEQKQQQRKEE